MPVINEAHLHNNRPSSQLNKIRVNEYIQKEKGLLDSKDKILFCKKPFHQIKSNISILQCNVEKYFALPKKSKAKEIKTKLNDYYNDKKICKEIWCRFE